MVAMVDWLLTLLEALEGSGLAQAVTGGLWTYPVIEIAHICGLAVLIGAAAMFDLRLLGFSSGWSVAQAARHLLPWVWLGFGIVVLSGFLLFAANATQLAAENPAFRLKMVLIGLAGLNAFAFHMGPFSVVEEWDLGTNTPMAAKVAAVVSLGLWISIVACGRLIAYV